MSDFKFTKEQRAWIDELKSTDKEQGSGYLNRDNKYCCLGIACELFDAEKEYIGGGTFAYFGDEACSGQESVAPSHIVEKLELYSNVGESMTPGLHDSLADLNDSGLTFKEIADILEKNPRDYLRGW